MACFGLLLHQVTDEGEQIIFPVHHLPSPPEKAQLSIRARPAKLFVLKVVPKPLVSIGLRDQLGESEDIGHPSPLGSSEVAALRSAIGDLEEHIGVAGLIEPAPTSEVLAAELSPDILSEIDRRILVRPASEMLDRLLGGPADVGANLLAAFFLDSIEGLADGERVAPFASG